MKITVNVEQGTAEEEQDLRDMAEHGASLMRFEDGRAGLTLKAWLEHVCQREIERLAGVAFNQREDKVARFRAIAAQLREERDNAKK